MRVAILYVQNEQHAGLEIQMRHYRSYKKCTSNPLKTPHSCIVANG